jgi:tetratricopeptide (TPR) repeat protein
MQEMQTAPLQGTGIGSFGEYYHRNQTDNTITTTAHSAFVEALAETGVIGLALLTGCLLLLLIPAVRLRADEAVPSLAAAFGAYVLHTGLDWDWLVPGLTLPALWCGFGVFAGNAVAARRSGTPYTRRIRWLLAVPCLAVAVLSGFGLVGSLAVQRAYEAAEGGRYPEATNLASDAARLQPWSYVPYFIKGNAEQALGRHEEARKSYEMSLSRDRVRWEVWLALASVSAGPERAAAIINARLLNPLGPDVIEFCRLDREPACTEPLHRGDSLRTWARAGTR